MKGELPPVSSSHSQGRKPKLFLSCCISILLCLSFYQHLPRIDALLQRVNPLQTHFDLEQLLLSVPDGATARHWSAYYTSGPHYSGEVLSKGLWTQAKWEEFGVDTTSIQPRELPFPVPKPVSRRLALFNQTDGEVVYEASLTENVTDVNPLTGETLNLPPFAAFAPSCNINASVVYANFGTAQDFEDLARANVSVEGKLALVKFELRRRQWYDIQQQTGIAGGIVYIDPQADGEITEANGYLPYPEGPARAPTSVCSRQDGPTPGMDAAPVPIMPISFADAVPILTALNGIGPRADELDPRWHGGQLGHRGVEYNVGPSPENFVLNMHYEKEDTQPTMYHVIGEIQGQIKDEVVIIGNHRDAWVAGAGDPGSGSAAMTEVIRSFGQAVQKGWRPLRTLMFISWDGDEIGMFGAAYWVKENLPWLFNQTVAYIEAVNAVSGRDLKFRISPLLGQLTREVTSRIQSPNQTIPGQTVLDVWGGGLFQEGGGDSVPFMEKTITSGHINFVRGPQDPVWHKHSGFDTVSWFDRFGDPTWQYHVTAAQIWALLAARLVDSPVYPFNVTEFAVALRGYLADIESLAKTRSGFQFDFDPLHEAVSRLHAAALHFDAEADLLRKAHTGCKSKPRDLFTKTQAANSKYRLFERQFYHVDEGDPEKNHVVFTPSSRTNQNRAPLPDLWLAVDSGNVTETEKWHNIIRSKVEDAIAHLQS